MKQQQRNKNNNIEKSNKNTFSDLTYLHYEDLHKQRNIRTFFQTLYGYTSIQQLCHTYTTTQTHHQHQHPQKQQNPTDRPHLHTTYTLKTHTHRNRLTIFFSTHFKIFR